MIIVDRDHYEELFNAADTDLHMMQAYLEDFHFPSVFRANIFDPVHSNAVRYTLTQNISALTPEIADELNTSIDEELGSRVTEGLDLILYANCRLDTNFSVSNGIYTC
jgi:hypothetical protein